MRGDKALEDRIATARVLMLALIATVCASVSAASAADEPGATAAPAEQLAWEPSRIEARHDQFLTGDTGLILPWYVPLYIRVVR